MIDTQAQAHIYLADQRGHSETSDFRSYHSFNFGAYTDESRKPFGALQLLNDDTLRAGASLSMQVAGNTDVLLIPVSGSLDYLTDLGTGSVVGFLEPAQVGILSLTAGTNFTISNPYETEPINFLQIWLTNSTRDFTPTINQTSFDLSQKNRLLPLAELTRNGCSIGQYDGRQEGTYLIKKPALTTQSAGVFAFVLQGAFEIQNRLLHEKDGLALHGVANDIVDFEALSADAILLLVDVLIDNSI